LGVTICGGNEGKRTERERERERDREREREREHAPLIIEAKRMPAQLTDDSSEADIAQLAAAHNKANQWTKELTVRIFCSCRQPNLSVVNLCDE